MKYNTAIRILKTISKPFFTVKSIFLEKLPKTGAVILAPNHISNIDPILMAVEIAKIREVRAMGKASLFTLPIIGNMARGMNHIPVHRGSIKAKEALIMAKGLLEQGEAVLIYPEGTIPKVLEEDGLGKLKNGVARLSLDTRVPILPIAQKGIDTFLSKNKKTLFFNFIKSIFKKHKHTIVFGELIYPIDGETINDLMLRVRFSIAYMLKNIDMNKNNSAKTSNMP